MLQLVSVRELPGMLEWFYSNSKSGRIGTGLENMQSLLDLPTGAGPLTDAGCWCF